MEGNLKDCGEVVRELSLFYEAIKEDHRIGPTHISIYMAIFHIYNLNAFSNPVNVTRSRLMELAKISGLATYHKCIRELQEYGYIKYSPSFNPSVSSKVFLFPSTFII